MTTAHYRLEPRDDDFWVVVHDDQPSDPYASKEAAFEAAMATIERAMAEGHAIEFSVPAGMRGRFV